MKINQLTEKIIGAAIEVHRALGPGLLESAYQECLCMELTFQRVPYVRQLVLPVEYKGHFLDCGYRLDLVAADAVAVEIKAVDKLLPIHEAQLLTYLRLGGWKVGLLINFNVPVLIDGVRRRVWGLEEDFSISAASRRYEGQEHPSAPSASRRCEDREGFSAPSASRRCEGQEHPSAPSAPLRCEGREGFSAPSAPLRCEGREHPSAPSASRRCEGREGFSAPSVSLR
jgi:GxxExxY protein